MRSVCFLRVEPPRTSIGAGPLYRWEVTCADRRSGVEMKTVAGEGQPEPDLEAIRAVRNAKPWALMLKSATALKDITDRDGFSES